METSDPRKTQIGKTEEEYFLIWEVSGTIKVQLNTLQ